MGLPIDCFSWLIFRPMGVSRRMPSQKLHRFIIRKTPPLGRAALQRAPTRSTEQKLTALKLYSGHSISWKAGFKIQELPNNLHIHKHTRTLNNDTRSYQSKFNAGSVQGILVRVHTTMNRCNPRKRVVESIVWRLSKLWPFVESLL